MLRKKWKGKAPMIKKPFKRALRRLQITKTNSCFLHVRTTKSNTFCTVTTLTGDVQFHMSIGKLELTFKTTREKRSNPALFHLVKVVCNWFSKKRHTIKFVSLVIHGVKKLDWVRTLIVTLRRKNSIHFLEIYDRTAVPHNGCRKKKKRRT